MLARTLMLALLLVATALAVGACGDDDSSEGDGGSSADTAAQADDDAPEPAGDPETTLFASVGPGFDISLKDASGADVASLPAGTYTIEVEDLSGSHNFHLIGEGVDESTPVATETTDTWTVELAAGDYSFQCDPHAAEMRGEFTVT